MTRPTLGISSQKKHAMAISFIAFVCVFVFEAIRALRFHTVSSIANDDYSTLYYVSRFADKEWAIAGGYPYLNLLPSYLFSFVIRLLPSNGMSDWKIILLAFAFIRSLSAFVITNILCGKFNINRYVGLFSGVGFTLFLLSNSAFIEFDSFELLVALLLFALLIDYFESSNRRKTILMFVSLVAAFILMNTDAIMIVPFAVISVFFIAKEIKDKRWGYAAVVLVMAGLLMYFSVAIQNLCIEKYLPADFNKYRVEGTFGYIFNRLASNVWRIFSLSGIKLIFFGLIMFVWTAIIYSIGLILGIPRACIDAINRKEENRAINMTALLFTISLGACFVTRILVELNKLAVIDNHDWFDASYFLVLKGFAPIIVIMTILSVIKVFQSEKDSVKSRKITYSVVAGIGLIVAVFMYYAYSSVVQLNSVPFLVQNKGFLLSLTSINSSRGFLVYFLIFTFISIAVFEGISSADNRKWLVTLLVIPLGIHYLISGSYSDYEYAKESNLLTYVDAIGHINAQNDNVFNKADNIYYYGDVSIARLEQFVIWDSPVQNCMPDLTSSEYILLTTTPIDTTSVTFDDCYFAQLDDNEFMYLKGDKNLSLFDGIDLEIEEIYDDEFFPTINRAYEIILERTPSFGELKTWADYMHSEGGTYFDIINCFFLSTEYLEKGLDDYQTFNRMVTMCIGDNMYYTSQEYKSTVLDMLENGATVTEVLEVLYYSDYCTLN